MAGARPPPSPSWQRSITSCSTSGSSGAPRSRCAHLGSDADDLAPPGLAPRVERADPVTEDVALQRLQLGRRAPGPARPPASCRASPYAASASAWRPAAVERQHQLRAQRSLAADARRRAPAAHRPAPHGGRARGRHRCARPGTSAAAPRGARPRRSRTARNARPEAPGRARARARRRAAGSPSACVAARERVAPLGGQALEPPGVDGVGVVEPQLVPVRPPDDRLLAQHAAKARDDDLERVRRMGGQRVAPQGVDRDVRRNHVRAVDEQTRAAAAAARSRERALRPIASTGPRIRNCTASGIESGMKAGESILTLVSTPSAQVPEVEPPLAGPRSPRRPRARAARQALGDPPHPQAPRLGLAPLSGPVAQWLEQRTHNPSRVGSTPTRPMAL